MEGTWENLQLLIDYEKTFDNVIWKKNIFYLQNVKFSKRLIIICDRIEVNRNK
jgi:hypothetical protein